MSSLKSQWDEILVARRVEQVEGEPLVLEAPHRGGDRDAALALHPIRAHPPPPRAFNSPASCIHRQAVDGKLSRFAGTVAGLHR